MTGVPSSPHTTSTDSGDTACSVYEFERLIMSNQPANRSRFEFYNPNFLPVISLPLLSGCFPMHQSPTQKPGCWLVEVLTITAGPIQRARLSKLVASLHCQIDQLSTGHICPVHVSGNWIPLPYLLLTSRQLKSSLSQKEEGEIRRGHTGRKGVYQYQMHAGQK